MLVKLWAQVSLRAVKWTSCVQLMVYVDKDVNETRIVSAYIHMMTQALIDGEPIIWIDAVTHGISKWYACTTSQHMFREITFNLESL